ncbi:hypothetical protein QJ48_28365 [Paenibacillus sp. A3]|uniref:hypothetical protein n=1 Tax=Paenibacillus sp. A3 TaxID=1337054 RepID=UPI0006D5B702|nr:hypothetical protein [Paenibacillus sp. A3]KPV56353.1 hypothetical protein QJ48_28365 [Paenibacillus sp. A3]
MIEEETQDEFQKEYLYWKQYIETLESCTPEELFAYVNTSYVSKEVIYRLLDDYEIPYKRNYSKLKLYQHFALQITAHKLIMIKIKGKME